MFKKNIFSLYILCFIVTAFRGKAKEEFYWTGKTVFNCKYHNKDFNQIDFENDETVTVGDTER